MPTTWKDDFIKKLTIQEIHQYEQKLEELRKKYIAYFKAHPVEKIGSDLKLRQEVSATEKEITTLLCNLGRFYEITSRQDNQYIVTAFSYYEEAVKYEDRYAIVKVAHFLMHGKGCIKDADAALKLYEKASSLGSAVASYSVAYYCEKGTSDLLLQQKALNYYQLALKQDKKVINVEYATAAIERIQERLQKASLADKSISPIQEEELEESPSSPSIESLQNQDLSPFTRLKLLYSLFEEDYVKEYGFFEGSACHSVYIPCDPLSEPESFSRLANSVNGMNKIKL